MASSAPPQVLTVLRVTSSRLGVRVDAARARKLAHTHPIRGLQPPGNVAHAADMSKESKPVVAADIAGQIHIIRGQRVLLDSDREPFARFFQGTARLRTGRLPASGVFCMRITCKRGWSGDGSAACYGQRCFFGGIGTAALSFRKQQALRRGQRSEVSGQTGESRTQRTEVSGSQGANFTAGGREHFANRPREAGDTV